MRLAIGVKAMSLLFHELQDLENAWTFFPGQERNNPELNFSKVCADAAR